MYKFVWTTFTRQFLSLSAADESDRCDVAVMKDFLLLGTCLVNYHECSRSFPRHAGNIGTEVADHRKLDIYIFFISNPAMEILGTLIKVLA